MQEAKSRGARLYAELNAFLGTTTPGHQEISIKILPDKTAVYYCLYLVKPEAYFVIYAMSLFDHEFGIVPDAEKIGENVLLSGLVGWVEHD
jgi:hypothetical protein